MLKLYLRGTAAAARADRRLGVAAVAGTGAAADGAAGVAAATDRPLG
jgi:hypothetical protein